MIGLGIDAPVVLVLALLVDATIGDPPWLWRRIPHPVVWFGAVIAAGDRRLNRESWSHETRRVLGAILLAILVAVAALGAASVQWALGFFLEGLFVLAFLASVLLAQRSLYRHVARVRDAFGTGGLTEARVAVATIVGRDPAHLDEAGVARAAIESAAENFSDGVVAPAFWFAVAGLPGLAVYKAVNTADSMIGHLSPRYRAFGWAAARLDDVLNYVPARLAGYLITRVAPLVGGQPVDSLRVMRRDAPLHRSPNAGWPEAAMARALGLALAGPRVYASGRVEDPYLNPRGRRDAGPGDIDRALRVLLGACGLHMAGWAVLAILLALL